MTENEKNLRDLEEWFKMNPTEVAAYEFQKKQLEEEMARESEQTAPPPVQQTAAPTQKQLERAEMYVEKGDQAIKDHDVDEAFKWYSKATALGCTKAEVQSGLGDCYRIGFGVTEDYAKAAEWYSKAAAQGHAWSQYQMGICLYNGRGIPKDTDRAIEMWRRSAAQGFHLAIGVLEQLKSEGLI